MNEFMLQYKNRAILSIFSTLLLVFTFFFFGPTELYFTNHTILWFSMYDVIKIAVLWSGVLFVALSVILYIIPWCKVRFYCSVFIWALGLCLYVQGNYMQRNYGVLNGQDVQWESFKVWGIINSIIWILIISVVFLIAIQKKHIFSKIVMFGTIFIISIQSMTLLYLGMTVDTHKENKLLTNDYLYEVSTKQNVIVILLDAFDGTFMNMILEEDPHYLDDFDGFTYYSDATGMYPSTKAAIPHILTGYKYLNEEPYSEYIGKAIPASKLFQEIRNNNVNAGVYAGTQFVEPSAMPYISNMRLEAQIISDQIEFAKLLYQFVSTKYFPHSLKRHVWMYTGDFERIKESLSNYRLDDIAYYRNLKEERLSTMQDTAFRFYHMTGAHAPFHYNEDVCEPEDGEIIDALEQSRGALNIVREYLSQMKELGVYDKSFIVVLADHGTQNLAANPLLLIKDYNATQTFTVSDAPVSFADISDLLADRIANPGRAYSIKQYDTEPRQFLYYGWEDSAWNIDYVPSITEYMINGGATELSKFLKSGHVYSTDGLTVVSDEVFALDMQSDISLAFGRNGSAYKYIRYGIDAHDTSFSNPTNIEAGLAFDFGFIPQQDLILSVDFDIMTMVSDKQTVLLYANNHLISEKEYGPEVTGDVFVIPKELFESSVFTLDFRFPDGRALNTIGYGGDSRVFSIVLHNMTMSWDTTD